MCEQTKNNKNSKNFIRFEKRLVISLKKNKSVIVNKTWEGTNIPLGLTIENIFLEGTRWEIPWLKTFSVSQKSIWVGGLLIWPVYCKKKTTTILPLTLRESMTKEKMVWIQLIKVSRKLNCLKTTCMKFQLRVSKASWISLLKVMLPPLAFLESMFMDLEVTQIHYVCPEQNYID